MVVYKINQKQQPDFTKTAPIIEWQETSQAATSTRSYIMPDPADVGSGKDYATNLTSENVYVGLATSYRFDSEQGRYYLEDMIYQDPTTVDFSTHDYYICSSGTSVSVTGILNSYSSISCSTLYRVSRYNFSENTTISRSDGISYPAIRYVFTIDQTSNQIELESDKSDKGLYATNDDYGTSYYYRGSVNNNYVYFAGFYWRVIRINGDGSIRLLYAGTTKDATGESLGIGNSKYNDIANKPLYVGYMYGNSDGSTLEEVYANTNDSTIKTYLDNWYSTNLSEYSAFIADPGFCNDRTLSTGSNNGNGIQTAITTNYAIRDRYYTNCAPTLICPDASRDLFTLSGNTQGNQSLSYPVGMITVDELMYAGMVSNVINKFFYLYSSHVYMTMTPMDFDSDYSSAFMFSLQDGYVAGYGTVQADMSVRPVINLNADVEIESGIGTQNEPFIVKIN